MSYRLFRQFPLKYSKKLLDYNLEIAGSTKPHNMAESMTDKKDDTENVFVERRKGGDRRKGDRRVSAERRQDSRNGDGSQKKNIRTWLKQLTNARLGVDRRKGDRRKQADRRQPKNNAQLTKDEISDLLSS